ncbi:GNAT family N-acetyltransferase [Velocimicrobium porci]|uniref:GNAT family N-acetyltransferase n=1 Tax=Velocimicrobium porci TaxID=2606634 RepID=A0A6L5Y1P3_9FIRM|nr:GNAT family protein [Velocimicrobium porci]MSS64955.1 GNAT family N-acetyltransferase [Velocimicrobium porci]
MNLIHNTDRLIIRVLGPEWATEVCNFYKRNQNFFEPFEPQRVPNFYTIPFQEATLCYELKEFINFRYIRLFLFEPIDPCHIIGSISFSNIKKGSFQSCNLGYKMDFSFCNQGYMTEALNYCIDNIIFGEYGLHRIESTVLPTNYPSIRLMERLNFQQEGIARDFAFLENKWRDHIKYARINSI